MMFHQVLIALTFCYHVSSKYVDRNDLRVISTESLNELKSQLEGVVGEYNKYQDEVVTAQQDCQKILEPIKKQCSVCMQQKCEKRIQELSCHEEESVDWHNRVARAFRKMKDDIKRYFDEKFPKFVQITNEITDFFNRLGLKIKEKFISAFNTVKDFFNSWGRRKRSAERISPPSSCNDFSSEEKMKSSCEYYSIECDACKPTTEDVLRQCPKIQNLMEAGKDFGWLNSALTYDGKDFFTVNSIYYEPGSSKGESSIDANIFGEPVNFVIKGNFDNYGKAIPSIVQEAIKEYRINFGDSSGLEKEEFH